MYLARLDINGFKSFGEKVVLEFAPGVTGIVGPNGSGKSNVVDAIRWSLGEQGYKGIRLEKSDDVIFLGSKGKGKMSRASVEMLIKDLPKDKGVPYEELSIGRHVFRDGEGEYFMQKSQVRLKDILETLARLSVSTKNYSIVTQGMSDQLLRFTPQELRATVEEASGVKEWQIKKRDAERKLERSGEHMLQVQALLAELKPYLNNLRAQMKRWERRDEFARRVQELKEQKIFVRARELAARKGSIDARKGRIQHDITTKEQEKGAFEAAIKDLETQLANESKDKHAAQDQKVQSLYDRRMELERELIRAESQLAAYAQVKPKSAPDTALVAVRVSEARKKLEAIAGNDSLEELKRGVADVIAALKETEKLFEKNGAPEIPQELRDAQKKAKDQIIALEREMDEAKRAGRDAYAREQQLKDSLFQKERAFHRLEDELERALQAESSLMEEFGRFGEEERQILEEARQHMADAPGELEKLLKVLEVSYGGRELPMLQRIEEDLIRAQVHLSDVGDVDANVKSEYERTEERFNFLTKELEDVLIAKDDLQNLAVQLEDEIRKRFEEAFIGVNEEFGKYMQTIFGGGKGELVKLVPPKPKHDEMDAEDGDEDDASSDDSEEKERQKEGIAVHVELPGKRIKSLELLSGGERSLTSLAFLFALIATMKPPFVVLDEVDAALDEGNSKRFANLLETVKLQTQCILVTHNRTTMSVANALYGVTMGGDGISRILSIKLEK